MNEPKPNSLPEVPDTLNEVAQSLQATVFNVWADFVSHIPYLVASILVLFFTWVIASLLERFANRLLSRWKRRQSIRDLITRLLVITVWVLGLLPGGHGRFSWADAGACARGTRLVVSLLLASLFAIFSRIFLQEF